MFAMFFFASIPINPNRQFWIKVSATQFKLESKTLPLWVFSIEHMIEIDFVQHSFRVNIQVLTSFSKLKRSFCYLLSYTWQCFSVCVCSLFSFVSFQFDWATCQKELSTEWDIDTECTKCCCLNANIQTKRKRREMEWKPWESETKLKRKFKWYGDGIRACIV